MNDRQNRRIQTFRRVQDFGLEHQADFAPTSLARQLFTSIGSIVDELDGHAATQTSSSGAARQGTATREQARLAVREDLKAICRTADAVSDEVPGLDDKFRMPPEDNDQNLLSAARAFLADATPLVAEFIAHEMPADFLDDLRADIKALEDAISAQSTGKGQRVAAGAALDEAIDKGVTVARKLDAIMKNKYANNPAVLAQWRSASHTERDPRHKAPASTSTTPGAAEPTPGTTSPTPDTGASQSGGASASGGTTTSGGTTSPTS